MKSETRAKLEWAARLVGYIPEQDDTDADLWLVVAIALRVRHADNMRLAA